MKRASVLSRTFVLGVLSWLVFVGCSSGTGGGCLAPIPSGRYAGPKTNDAVSIRLSANGFNYLNTNWQTLLNQFAPGGVINVPIACNKMNVTAVGDVILSDQGGPNCSSSSCGQMDQKCCQTATDPGCNSSIVDKPANVKIQLVSFALTPIAPDKLEGSIGLTINTGKIYVDSVDRSLGECFYLSGVNCSFQYDTASSSPSNQIIDATVKFTIDTKFDELLAVDVQSPIVGTQICGASGAPAAPKCLDPNDISLNGENTCCDAYAGIADWGPIKNFVLQQISPILQSKVKAMVHAQTCEACGNAGDPPCLTLPNASSTCDTNNNYCVDSTDATHCVPRFLGVEGRVSPASFLGNYGVPSSALLDLSIAAGSSVSVDTGFNVGTRAGIEAVQVADCVPALPTPTPITVSAPNFDATTNTNVSGYHIALGVSNPFLNMAMYQAHQSGTLCIAVNSSTVGVMNTGLFKTFLPSLGRLATRDGKDAPMMIVLRPAKAPEVRIGEGTYDPVTKKPIKPLILLTLPDLTIDFYAMIDDRYARLFSLTADISLPLSLIFEGCSSVTPAIGDLNQLITNISTSNSEMLAEDPKVLADLIPAVIGLAEPAVQSALKPFALPAIAGFKLQVMDATGVNSISGTDWYEHLGIYAKLINPNGSCAVAQPTTYANVARVQVPAKEQMKLTGHGLPWPRVFIAVKAKGAEGTPEFAYRVDNGMWTTFLRTGADGLLEVADPNFLLQGTHQIEVRSRMAEDPYGISAPVKVNATIDWDPPEVTLIANHAQGRLDVRAHDTVTPDADLLYAYKVGDGAMTEFGPARVIDLNAIEQQGGVTVYAKDALGNVGSAAYRVAMVDTRNGPQSQVTTPNERAAGCEATGGLFTLLAIFGASLLRRRRR